MRPTAGYLWAPRRGTLMNLWKAASFVLVAFLAFYIVGLWLA